MSASIQAAVVQLCARQDVAVNLDQCRNLIAKAARRGAELCVLPENFAYIGRLEEKARLAEPLSEAEPGPIVRCMQEAAREHHLHLVLGGTPIVSPLPGRFHNTCLVLDPQGAIVAAYQKIHLFDINIPGGAVFNESALVAPGAAVVTAPVGDAVLGLSICYDLRFPELYRQLVRQGATLLCVPAAFTLHTGKDHWTTLLRARAIENQCYLLAAAQHGAHTENRRSYGKSSIIDPWGAVIAQVSEGDGVAIAELDLTYLKRVRRELPCLEHRRIS